MKKRTGRLKAYLAQAMTGRTWREVVDEAIEAVRHLERMGLNVYSPVLKEWDGKSEGVIQASVANLKKHWKKDKANLEKCHLLVDIDPEKKSEGVAREIALMTYVYKRPVIRVYRKTRAPITGVHMLEGDVVANGYCDNRLWLNAGWRKHVTFHTA